MHWASQRSWYIQWAYLWNFVCRNSIMQRKIHVGSLRNVKTVIICAIQSIDSRDRNLWPATDAARRRQRLRKEFLRWIMPVKIPRLAAARRVNLMQHSDAFSRLLHLAPYGDATRWFCFIHSVIKWEYYEISLIRKSFKENERKLVRNPVPRLSRDLSWKL